jgi:hypothetical protein
MTESVQGELARRLRYIMHCGFVEIRNLAGVAGAAPQIHDLADAMEILPRYLDGTDEDSLEMIRFVLQDYKTRYPHSRDYLKYLDSEDVPNRY